MAPRQVEHLHAVRKDAVGRTAAVLHGVRDVRRDEEELFPLVGRLVGVDRRVGHVELARPLVDVIQRLRAAPGRLGRAADEARHRRAVGERLLANRFQAAAEREVLERRASAERIAADGLNAVAEGHVLQVRAAVELVFRDFRLLAGDGDGFEARVAVERRVAVAGVCGVGDVAADIDGVERAVGKHRLTILP